MDDFKKAFQDKRILVTGGTGSIGSEIVRQLVNCGPKQIRIYSRDDSKQFELQQELDSTDSKRILRFLIGDIRDKDRLNRAFNDIDVVFHAAALKHVPFCEANPFEAIKTNVQGTQNVLELAIDHKVEKLVAISSDKAVYPNTVLGISKLMMERLVLAAPNYSGHPEIKFSVVRFGNVINSRGSVIPLWLNQIKRGKEITVTHEKMERYFMSTANAVNLVFAAVSIMMGGEIFVLKMPKYNIHSLAQEVIKRFGNSVDIKIKIVGIREKEKMNEELFTEEEKELIVDVGPFNIIQPSEESFLARKNNYKEVKEFSSLEIEDIFSSINKGLI